MNDLLAAQANPEYAANQGDRWTFAAILPETGFVHTVHTAERTSQQAEAFVNKIKANSDGQAPCVTSDCWFYESALVAVYSDLVAVEYKGRGRRPNPRRVPNTRLRYCQVHKKRTKTGQIESISTRIVLGDEQEILTLFEESDRSRTINTDFVESRNGKYRKDNARLIRRSLCHSKKSIFHDASIVFVTQVFNYTRTVDGLKVEINGSAKRFEQKYRHRTPAMAEGLIDKCLTIKELLCHRPIYNKT